MVSNGLKGVVIMSDKEDYRTLFLVGQPPNNTFLISFISGMSNFLAVKNAY